MDSNLTQALYISFVGISLVFLFLLFLIVCSQVMSLIISKYFPAAKEMSKSINQPVVNLTQSSTKTAVISAVIHQYKNSK